MAPLLGFGSFLSPLMTAASTGVGAYEQGNLERQQREYMQGLQMVELLRQKTLDEQNRQMQQAQIADMAAQQQLRQAQDKRLQLQMDQQQASSEWARQKLAGLHPKDPLYQTSAPGVNFLPFLTADKAEQLAQEAETRTNAERVQQVLDNPGMFPQSAASVRAAMQKGQDPTKLRLGETMTADLQTREANINFGHQLTIAQMGQGKWGYDPSGQLMYFNPYTKQQVNAPPGFALPGSTTAQTPILGDIASRMEQNVNTIKTASQALHDANLSPTQLQSYDQALAAQANDPTQSIGPMAMGTALFSRMALNAAGQGPDSQSYQLTQQIKRAAEENALLLGQANRIRGIKMIDKQINDMTPNFNDYGNPTLINQKMDMQMYNINDMKNRAARVQPQFQGVTLPGQGGTVAPGQTGVAPGTSSGAPSAGWNDAAIRAITGGGTP